MLKMEGKCLYYFILLLLWEAELLVSDNGEQDDDGSGSHETLNSFLLSCSLCNLYRSALELRHTVI